MNKRFIAAGGLAAIFAAAVVLPMVLTSPPPVAASDTCLSEAQAQRDYAWKFDPAVFAQRCKVQ